MARYTGAVRFDDGTIRYFVYNGLIDMARPRLFESEQAAEDARDDSQSDVPTYCGGGEPVDVMPYYVNGDEEVMFRSTADRASGLITGPLSLDRAVERESGQWHA